MCRHVAALACLLVLPFQPCASLTLKSDEAVLYKGSKAHISAERDVLYPEITVRADSFVCVVSCPIYLYRINYMPTVF
jgi:hypothetical protein